MPFLHFPIAAYRQNCLQHLLYGEHIVCSGRLVVNDPVRHGFNIFQDNSLNIPCVSLIHTIVAGSPASGVAVKSASNVMEFEDKLCIVFVGKALMVYPFSGSFLPEMVSGTD
jgi:hypothetical protein